MELLLQADCSLIVELKFIKSLKDKLPEMDKEQLVALSNHLVTIYNLFSNSLEGWSIHSSAKKFDVQFEPKREQLIKKEP